MDAESLRSLQLIARDNVMLWRQAWQQATESNQREAARVAAEELEFWTNKSALLTTQTVRS